MLTGWKIVEAYMLAFIYFYRIYRVSHEYFYRRHLFFADVWGLLFQFNGTGLSEVAEQESAPFVGIFPVGDGIWIVMLHAFSILLSAWIFYGRGLPIFLF